MKLTLGILIHAVQLLAILACIIYLSNKRSTRLYRFLSVGWILILVQDLTMVVIGLFNPANNLWVYNIAFPLQLLFYMAFFSLLLGRRKWMLMMLPFALFAILNLLLWQGRVNLNTITIALGGIITVVLAFTKLYELYKQDTGQSLFRDPDFWISAGFIIYWGFASPYFAMYNYLWQEAPTFTTVYYYTFNFGLLILLNLSVIKTLQCSLRK